MRGLATERRLEQELGVRVERLEFVYKFTYQARFGELGAEHELCWVYLGRLATPPRPNATEIADTRFVAADELDRQLTDDAETYTPWFRMEWQRLRGEFADRLAGYTAATGTRQHRNLANRSVAVG